MRCTSEREAKAFFHVHEPDRNITAIELMFIDLPGECRFGRGRSATQLAASRRPTGTSLSAAEQPLWHPPPCSVAAKPLLWVMQRCVSHHLIHSLCFPINNMCRRLRCLMHLLGPARALGVCLRLKNFKCVSVRKHEWGTSCLYLIGLCRFTRSCCHTWKWMTSVWTQDIAIIACVTVATACRDSLPPLKVVRPTGRCFVCRCKQCWA